LIWESLFVNQKLFIDYYSTFSESYILNLQRFDDVRDDIDLETVSFILMGIANFVGLQILFKDKASEKDVDFVVEETMKMLDNGLFKQ
jgi:hypothetical protein